MSRSLATSSASTRPGASASGVDAGGSGWTRRRIACWASATASNGRSFTRSLLLALRHAGVVLKRDLELPRCLEPLRRIAVYSPVQDRDQIGVHIRLGVARVAGPLVDVLDQHLHGTLRLFPWQRTG